MTQLSNDTASRILGLLKPAPSRRFWLDDQQYVHFNLTMENPKVGISYLVEGPTIESDGSIGGGYWYKGQGH